MADRRAPPSPLKKPLSPVVQAVTVEHSVMTLSKNCKTSQEPEDSSTEWKLVIEEWSRKEMRHECEPLKSKKKKKKKKRKSRTSSKKRHHQHRARSHGNVQPGKSQRRFAKSKW